MRVRGMCHSPERLQGSVPSARALRVLGGLLGGHGLPVPLFVRAFPAGNTLRAAGPAGAASALPLPAPGGFALAARSLAEQTPTGERLELNLLPCSGSVPAQPQMDRAALLLLTNQEGRTWLIQSRSLPDEDLVTASRAGSSVCGSRWFYLLARLGTCACVLFLSVCLVICFEAVLLGSGISPVSQDFRRVEPEAWLTLSPGQRPEVELFSLQGSAVMPCEANIPSFPSVLPLWPP